MKEKNDVKYAISYLKTQIHRQKYGYRVGFSKSVIQEIEVLIKAAQQTLAPDAMPASDTAQ